MFSTPDQQPDYHRRYVAGETPYQCSWRDDCEWLENLGLDLPDCPEKDSGLALLKQACEKFVIAAGKVS